METFSALLAICAGNSPAPVNSPHKGQSRGAFLDLRLNKRLSKQSWGWRFGTLSRPLWRHSNESTPFLWNLSGQAPNGSMRADVAYILVSTLLPLGPFYKNGLTLIPAWISNCVYYKVWDEITNPSSNFNGVTVEVWVWISIFPHFTWHILLIHAGIKVNPSQ